jgi:hypothetical protein
MSEKDRKEMSIKVQVRYVSKKNGSASTTLGLIPTPWRTGAADWGRLSHVTVKEQLRTG